MSVKHTGNRKIHHPESVSFICLFLFSFLFCENCKFRILPVVKNLIQVCQGINPGQTPKCNRSFSLNPTAKQVTFSDPVTLQLARVQGPGPDLLGIMESLQLGT